MINVENHTLRLLLDWYNAKGSLMPYVFVSKCIVRACTVQHTTALEVIAGLRDKGLVYVYIDDRNTRWLMLMSKWNELDEYNQLLMYAPIYKKYHKLKKPKENKALHLASNVLNIPTKKLSEF